MNNLPYSPHDLLPSDPPRLETYKDDSTFFYENVVKHLIPDIIDMEANGIPINLDKVAELEEVLVNVLDKVHEKLRTNPLMLEFLNESINKTREDKTKQLEEKKKEPKDFIKEFDIKNKIHRTYVVNYFLLSREANDLVLEEWSIKDLKKLNQIIGSAFVQNLIDKKIEPWMKSTIDCGMMYLADAKCEAYNKNKINSKIENLTDDKLIKSFNPGSPKQLQDLFNFFEIESETKTPKGNPSYDRNELERIQRLLKSMIDEKE